MATITQLETDNKNLNNINNDVQDIVRLLEAAVSDIDTLINNIDSRYSVDDNSTPIIDRAKALKESIGSTSSYLSRNILNSIESSIRSNNITISNLKELEKKSKEETKTTTTTTSKTTTGGYSKTIKAVNDTKKKDNKWNKW